LFPKDNHFDAQESKDNLGSDSLPHTNETLDFQMTDENRDLEVILINVTSSETETHGKKNPLHNLSCRHSLIRTAVHCTACIL